MPGPKPIPDTLVRSSIAQLLNAPGAGVLESNHLPPPLAGPALDAPAIPARERCKACRRPLKSTAVEYRVFDIPGLNPSSRTGEPALTLKSGRLCGPCGDELMERIDELLSRKIPA